MHTNELDGLKTRFKELIDKNLDGVDYLEPMVFRDIRDEMRGRGFKFYQYRPPTIRSIGQLRNGELWFSNPKTFNDVFEGMVRSKDDNSIDVKKVIDTASNAVTISCFSETRDNQLMYAHYAESFTGLCIEYDYDRMLNCVHDIMEYFFPVIYQEKPSDLAKMAHLSEAITNRENKSIANGPSSDAIIDDLISYFVHKPKMWEYEKEWRLIVPVSMFSRFALEAGGGTFHGIESLDCISAIYLAANINGYVEELVKDIIRDKNSARNCPSERIKVYKTHILQTSYSIGWEEIRL